MNDKRIYAYLEIKSYLKSKCSLIFKLSRTCSNWEKFTLEMVEFFEYDGKFYIDYLKSMKILKCRDRKMIETLESPLSS